jgi:hypothetical protein
MMMEHGSSAPAKVPLIPTNTVMVVLIHVFQGITEIAQIGLVEVDASVVHRI